MLNTVVLIGRICKPIELRYTPGGKAVATIRLAVDRGTKNPQGESETDFLDVVVWERQAENCANYLGVGRLIAVQGRLQIRQYETTEGQRREKAEVVADQVKFLESAPSTPEKPRPAPAGGMGNEINFGEDDDVPF